ncbi:MAG: hypothetical protein PWP14_2234 [Methanolobus sp.]|nr:hypothetical protein [Methanolobus sp.]
MIIPEVVEDKKKYLSLLSLANEQDKHDFLNIDIEETECMIARPISVWAIKIGFSELRFTIIF